MRCILGNEPCKILRRYRIEQAKHQKRIKGPFNLHGTITCSIAFNIEGIFMSKGMWKSWQEVSINLELDLLGLRRGLTIGNNGILSFATNRVSLYMSERYGKQLSIKRINQLKDLLDAQKEDWKGWKHIAKSKEDVKIQMKAVGICGSDIHYLKHLRNSRVALKEPMVLGHESAGVIIETGKLVKNLVVGDRVALEPGIPCYRCSFCKHGSNNLCREVKFFGSPPVHGSLAQQVVHPASLCHKLPDKVSLEEGAMCEPLSVGVHACRRASIQAGTHVLILGTGPIGLVTMLVARVFGAVRVVVTDIDEKRLSTAKELGADSTVLVSSDMNDLNDEVQEMQIAMEAPIDVTFDCVGTTKTMTTALNTTRSGGKVCLVGMHDDKMTLPLTAAAAREVDVLGIFRHRNTYKLCIDLLQSKKIDIQKLITHRFGFSQDEVIKGFKANAAGGSVIKVMFNL